MDSYNTHVCNAKDLLDCLRKETVRKHAQQQELLDILHESVALLETPDQKIWEMWFWPHRYACFRTALEMKIPKILCDHNVPMTADELAKATGGDKLLIVRMLRVLTATNIFTETEEETYAVAPISALISKAPPLEGGTKFMFDGAANSVLKMPEYLASNHYKNPMSTPGVFQHAFGQETNCFKWLMHNPSSLNDFNDLMAGQRLNRIDWFDFFPVEERLLAGSQGKAEDALLVDIGGGRGHELQAFKKKFPSAIGKLILQDLPDTIDQAGDLGRGIEKMKHDFFTLQPVKGARAYYFRSIMHDWPDEKCRDILRSTMSAMKPGYSKILINDWILPAKDVPLYPACLDINMLALFSGMERTETQWNDLLDSVGLEIVKLWRVPETEGCIEAVLK